MDKFGILFLFQMMEMLLEQIRLQNPPLNEISLESRLDSQDMLEMCFNWIFICMEMHLILEVGFNGYEVHIQKEQEQLNKLINDRIHELLPFVDEVSSWNRFALERAKQVLVHEEKELLKINERTSTLPPQNDNMLQAGQEIVY